MSSLITREQQARIENFIDIGDAFVQNLAKFCRLEKDFKHNLDLLLSEQRKREKHKREQAKLKKLREFEKKKEKENLEKLRAKRSKRNMRKLRRRKEMRKKRQKRRLLEKPKIK